MATVETGGLVTRNTFFFYLKLLSPNYAAGLSIQFCLLFLCHKFFLFAPAASNVFFLGGFLSVKSQALISQSHPPVSF